MTLLVVGSVAFDTIETPFGKAERVLGGSATFFLFAASYFTPQRLVGIVGADFPRESLAELQERGVDISGLTIDPQGKTFHLLRVRLDPALGLVPEISGHRLIVSIRLMRADADGRLKPVSEDLPVELALCA